MTQEAIHCGHAEGPFQQRSLILQAAFIANPKRFKGNPQHSPKLPIAASINPPKATTTDPRATQPSTLN
jgi:putative transposase